ncbi:hypothetical protein CC117_26960 [Parafrankia colletiae]|uniref:MrfA-like Zn-binding domain-containing protein n=1 Tax=Parafrankia colletiae TaxID=573497 RepID=A0A1S1QB55_9ACTN|nr:DrmB family protein [Parafrankia colletiae]MCK9903473.1 DrmB family protein [Frankia sp. Cpl3]OHV31170.1 hypothetical protein CC117_26960 [Parafrankia colletiae]
MTVRRVRRSQTISPFGVGAIIDVLGESFVAEDAGRWPWHDVISMPRLAEILGINEIGGAPADGKIPYYRFPRWLFCPSCRRMEKWSTSREKKNTVPACEHCPKRRLVPMRFVAICGNGHLSDVDWWRWAHSSRFGTGGAPCRGSRLAFETSAGIGGGLRSTQVRCLTCSAARSLEDLPTKDALRRVGQHCSGLQPWQIPSESESCEEHLRAVQRGASSVYFPRTISAIDIPPDSDWSTRSDPAHLLRENSDFRWLLEHPDHPRRAQRIEFLHEDTDIPVERIRQELSAAEAQADVTTVARTEADITPAEWTALTEPPATTDSRDYFQATATTIDATSITGRLADVAKQLEFHFLGVTTVERLREVRVLRGFERHTMAREIRANLRSRTGFLPGVEVLGEGFFLRLNEEALAAWEQRPEVADRAQRLVLRKKVRPELGWLADPTPRYLLLHTFAHLLLRQTAFEAGYSTSSLRERLYVTDTETGPRMAGVMIYTAAGDSEGTMGGLVRLGEPERLVPLVAGALAAARWCSFDPVCGESSGQGLHGLSLAACHACSLAPETSCVASNRLLDRRMVVDEEFGFFRDVLTTIEDAYGTELR